MGLTTFSGNHPTLKEAKVVKNYLNEKMLELRKTLLSIEQQDKIILTASNEGS